MGDKSRVRGSPLGGGGGCALRRDDTCCGRWNSRPDRSDRASDPRFAGELQRLKSELGDAKQQLAKITQRSAAL